MYSSIALLTCQALIAAFGGEKVSLPGSSAYNTALSTYFSQQSIAVQPQCIVSPQTSADVSAAIKLLTSKTTGPKFAIRSAGHLWIPNASNEPGGITIDLQHMTSIELSEDHKTVSVGTGATWDAVYAHLDPLGLSVAGGRIGGVGVGGLTLGGGLSYFGPRRGWTCDTVSAFEVVLADGSIVRADENHNVDLFQGLRGGNNNFGVVTRIDFKTFEQGPLWYTSTYNPLSTIKDVAKIFATISKAENYDEYASFITGFGYSQTQGMTIISNELMYSKNVENPPYFEDFLSLPTLASTTATLNASALAVRGASLLPPGQARYMFATTTFIPTESMILAAFEAWNGSLDGVRDIKGLTWSLSLEALPPGLYARYADSNSLGLGSRARETMVVCLLSQAWSDPADDERVYAASAALVDAVEAEARRLDVYDPFLYLNYAAPWQDPIASYGAASVERLRKLRDRVDPTGVFTEGVPGGFKIPCVREHDPSLGGGD